MLSFLDSAPSMIALVYVPGIKSLYLRLTIMFILLISFIFLNFDTVLSKMVLPFRFWNCFGRDWPLPKRVPAPAAAIRTCIFGFDMEDSQPFLDK